MNPLAFGTLDTSNTTSLPLGNLLLDKKDKDYHYKLAKLERVQEIIEDFTLENSKEVEVNAKLAVIYADKQGVIPQIVQDFVDLAQEFFEVALVDLELLENFSGSFGGFNAKLNNKEIVEFAQAVLFVSEEELLRFRGVYNVADFKNPESLLEKLKKNIGIYSYKEMIGYQENLCQYHHRREKHCTRCANVCPTFGVDNNDGLMELIFSPIDCIACGACVGVCPTNCLEYEELPKEGLGEIIEQYKGQRIFLCNTQDYRILASQNKNLPSDFLPLVLPSLLMLNENDLLSMVQMSGNALVVYTQNLSAPMEFLNHITQQIYQQDSIFAVQQVESLSQLELPQIESYFYQNRYNKPYRESFAQRLQYMVKDEDYGLAKSVPATQSRKDSVFYGEIKVNTQKCTLCLSCVGACNVNAIFARSDDFSLRFNASLCTTCGYCVASCPEDAMELHKEGIMLNPEFFRSQELAKDEPFLCVECGKVFSTKKSIEKVLLMIGDSFAKDTKKFRTIQCCPDCKVKVMLDATNAIAQEREADAR
ncbi:MAG: 4Fe-4S binding protein [Helicobacter sp.]|uniref:4Fe-4S binding protein n=1 Tax=Helicobacter sp. TaxID=218 RepID=UPI0023CBE908|nr:4Fe-4S binding protein [Helicobacter sp.]MDE5925628.1 4Fe-4S binding protein [Helicobacter sp.]MDE7174571.1 4Fe-4S binding protein [Helicobacter sp.]